MSLIGHKTRPQGKAHNARVRAMAQRMVQMLTSG